MKFRFKEVGEFERRKEEIPRHFKIWCAYGSQSEKLVGFFVIEEGHDESSTFRFLISKGNYEFRNAVAEVCEEKLHVFAADFSKRHWGGKPFNIINILGSELVKT